MSKRKYTHIKLFEKEILEMKDAGKTKREIAEALIRERANKRLLKTEAARSAKNCRGYYSKSARPSKQVHVTKYCCGTSL